jgi:predicted phosphoribosyltransferase
VERLKELRLNTPVVLGLARGGVPVAHAVAVGLGAPLDVFVAHKVSAPGQAELGIAAVAEGLEQMVVSDTAQRLGVDPRRLATLVKGTADELARRISLYRGGRPLLDVAGREVIVVDDGLATGVTAAAALMALRLYQPDRLLLAVPVGDREAIDALASFADDVVCVRSPARITSVGEWYWDFSQTTDDEVIETLARHRPDGGNGGPQ